MRFGETPATELPPETVIRLQNLSRLRFRFVDQVSGLKNKILAILDQIFPEYEECFSSVFVQTSKALLKRYPEPEELAQVDLSELAAFLAKHSRGRLGPVSYTHLDVYKRQTGNENDIVCYFPASGYNTNSNLGKGGYFRSSTVGSSSLTWCMGFASKGAISYPGYTKTSKYTVRLFTPGN